MNFMMKTGIAHLIVILTCRFLKVIFSDCPQIAWTIPILIFRKPLPPIFSFTESSKIFSTLRIFCQFSYLDTCHLPPDTLDLLYLPLATCHMTRASLGSPPRKPAPPPRTAGYSYCKAGYSYCTAGSPGFSAQAQGPASPEPSPAQIINPAL